MTARTDSLRKAQPDGTVTIPVAEYKHLRDLRKINNRLSKLTNFEIEASETSIRSWHTRWVHEQYEARVKAEVGGAA